MTTQTKSRPGLKTEPGTPDAPGGAPSRRPADAPLCLFGNRGFRKPYTPQRSPWLERLWARLKGLVR